MVLPSWVLVASCVLSSSHVIAKLVFLLFQRFFVDVFLEALSLVLVDPRKAWLPGFGFVIFVDDVVVVIFGGVVRKVASFIRDGFYVLQVAVVGKGRQLVVLFGSTKAFSIFQLLSIRKDY